MAYVDLRCTTSTSNLRKNGRVRINYTAGNGTVKITSIQGYRTDRYESSGDSSSNKITVVVGGVSSGSVSCRQINFGANSSPKNWSAFSKTYSGLNGNVTIRLTVNFCNMSDISGSVWTGTVNAGSAMVTISYNANGGTNAPSAQTVERGKQTNLSSVKPTKGSELSAGYLVTLQSNGGTCNPTSLTSQKETVYTFKNWNTNSSGTGTSYNAGAAITPSANMTLYAQYNAVTTNKSVLLPDCTKTGLVFRGWSTSDSEYIPVPKNYTPTSNVTLYAFYSEIKKLMKCKIGEEFVDVGSIKIRVGDQWKNVYRINLRNSEGTFDEK